jgi:transposase
MHEHSTVGKAAQAEEVSGDTVRRIIRKYEMGGLNATLYDDERPGRPALLRPDQMQAIVKLAGSIPPGGSHSWSASRLAQEAIRRKIVDAVSADTILRLLRDAPKKAVRWRRRSRRKTGKSY